MDARQMREIPIADFLNAMGIHPTKQKGNVLWYSAPYRTERTPSFKVDIAKNVWFDFGTGNGGDIFDLAGAFIGSEDFLLRAAFIAKSGTCPFPVIERPQRNEEKEPIFEDIWVRPLQDAKLLGYLKERGINAHVAIPTARRFDTVCMATSSMPSAFVTMPEDWSFATAFSRVAYRPRTFP